MSKPVIDPTFSTYIDLTAIRSAIVRELRRVPEEALTEDLVGLLRAERQLASNFEVCVGKKEFSVNAVSGSYTLEIDEEGKP